MQLFLVQYHIISQVTHFNLALFPGLHAQFLLLEKQGEGLEGFIM